MKRPIITLLCPAMLLVLGCGPAERQPVSETRPVTSPEAEVVDTATQLGMPELAGRAAVPPAPAAPTGMPEPITLGYDLPEGWTALPERPMREINLGVEGAESTECFVSVIPGDAGGLVMNVNRWAGQLGLEDLSEEVIEALPRIPMLGREAVAVSLEGHYRGMRGESDVPEATLLGAIAFLDSHAVFVKFTGPTPVVQAQRAAFDAFCASLRLEDAAPAPAVAPEAAAPAAPAATAPAATDATAAGEASAGPLSWVAPDSWQRGPDRPMRAATYTVADSPETECYITVLGGDGGGLGANLSRWRAQMGQPTPFTPAEIEAMPRVPMLGTDATLVALEGDYTGMTGPTFPGYALLGTVALLDGQAIFVRMTGPTAIVEREREAFLAFCASMKVAS